MSYTPGFGDSETWGPCTGAPADPRTPEGDELMDGLQEAVSEAISDLQSARNADNYEAASSDASSAIGWLLDYTDIHTTASECVWRMNAQQIGKLLVAVIASLRGEDDFYKDDNSLVIGWLQAASESLVDGVKQ